MPPVNPAVTAGVIAISITVAAAIAVYESPELRRMADDLRRRIAEAFHSLGDGIQPTEREAMAMPMFNRPEDAEEFLRSRGIQPNQDSGVEADEETRRRQREELLYWNRLHLEKKEREGDVEKEQAETHTPRRIPVRGPSFDDFMQEDNSAERGSGTFVFNTGASIPRPEDNLVRRRGADGHSGVRGLNSSVWANPFGDEHGIELDETHPVMPLSNTVLSPERDEIMSETDIYGVTEPSTPAPALIDVEPRPELTASPEPRSWSPVPATETLDDAPTHPSSRAWSPLPATASLEEALNDVMQNIQSRSVDGAQLLERESQQSQLGADEYVTAGQEDRNGPEAREAFESIQAWAAAAAANPAFYSPLPVSPAAPRSEAEVVSVAGDSDFEEVDAGMLTPTDSGSVAGSGVDVGREDAKSTDGNGEGNRYYDVVSDDESIVPTPTSWTEVGSVVSESEEGGVREYARA